MKFARIVCLCAIGQVVAGCGPASLYLRDTARIDQIRERAVEALKRGVGYDALPSVRAQAIESLEAELPRRGLPWIRSGLIDTHPAVRFAACMAVGALGDQGSRASIIKLLSDRDDSVKAAAIYALHCMGDTRYTAQLAAMLKDHSDIRVRCNAALVLGRLGEAGAIPLLAGVVGCKDDALHTQALEALVLLGNDQAMQQMTFVANSGNGPEEVFALNVLAMTGDERFRGAMEHKLVNGSFLETRLAAARGLGELGSNEGLQVALEGIRFNDPDPNLENDPPENQLMRIRQMAAVALGAIGDPAALPALGERLEDNSDPRVQVAAAKAILRILNKHERKTSPFAGIRSSRSRTS